jgi:hypothetical protein
MRTTTTGDNGSNPSVSTPAGSLSTDLTHVVYTRDAAGQARVYLDNVEVVSATIGGDLSKRPPRPSPAPCGFTVMGSSAAPWR